jgi:TatD DNase family protein
MMNLPELIDSHCHLTDTHLRVNLDGVLARAAAVGVTRMVCAAGTIGGSRVALALARRYGNVWSTAGVQPHDAKDTDEHYIAQLEQLAADGRNVAIGEIGLDYHYDHSPRDVQQRVFAEQLALARRLGKPVVIHTREAFDDTLAVLRESGVDLSRVVLHCCTEPADNVRRSLDAGTMVSFSGIVTFKNAAYLRESAAIVPDGRLLIETDAPWCSPVPVRQIRINEPAHVAHVAACLAAVRGTDVATVARATTANAVRLFGL